MEREEILENQLKHILYITLQGWRHLNKKKTVLKLCWLHIFGHSPIDSLQYYDDLSTWQHPNSLLLGWVL